jgi:hypothetical protein
MRGGEHPSFSGVETHPGGRIDVYAGKTFSTPNFVDASYKPTGGRRRSRRSRRSRRTRRSRRRMRGGDASSPMGGDGKGGVATSFVGSVDGTPWPVALREAGTTR